MEQQEPVGEVQSFFTFTNVLLLSILIYILYARLTKRQLVPNLAKPLEPLAISDYTPEHLQKYNGVTDPHILMAVKGKVYDVTAGSQFYGPKGPYKNFGGRDASRALAMGSFDEEMFVSVDGPIDPLRDLDEEQQKALDDWVSHFEGKYIFAGRLLENGTTPLKSD